MSTEPVQFTALELLPAEQREEINTVVVSNGIQAEAALTLQTSFAPFFKSAQEILLKSRGIVVTDVSQKLETKLARECRLALRAVRVEAEKAKKAMKEESLRRGKAIDGFYNILLHLTETEEARLDEQEKFAERQEQARKAKLKTDREEALKPFEINTSFYRLDEMPEDAFAQLLENTKAAHGAKIEAARKAEEDRIAAENARLKEQARIREENARLKREADEREAAAKVERERVEKEKEEAARAAKKELDRREAMAADERRKHEETAAEIRRIAEENAAKIKAESDKAAKVLAEKNRKEREAAEAKAKAERDAIEAKARAEREAIEATAREERTRRNLEQVRLEQEANAARAARDKLAAEVKAREDAEKAALAVEQAAARKAAAAPDKDKLMTYANSIRAMELPTLSDARAVALVNLIDSQREKFALWIEDKAGAL